MIDYFLEKAKNGQWESDVHAYSFEDLNLVLDINSGSIHTVDKATYDVIRAFQMSKGDRHAFWDGIKNYNPDNVYEIINELYSLVKDETLFTTTEIYDKPTSKLENIIKSLCLHVSHDCNLSCGYCFAGEGNFGGPRNVMSLEVGKKALDFLLEMSGARPTCEVDFFGGEPLLNWQVVKELVHYGKKRASEKGKVFRFTLTTNGLLLDKDKEDFLNKENISVVLSIDGRKEIHDKMRPLRSGKGSYDFVAPKIKSLVESRNNQNYYVRGTFTRHNMDFSKDVLFLADEGYKEISLEPVVAPPEEDYALRNEDKEVLVQEYKVLAKEYLKRKKQGKPFNFFHFNIDLENGPCIPKRITGCGAGYQYLAVSPEGDLYPCHQFVGKDEYLLGNLEQGIKNTQLVEKFRESHIFSKKCKKCWARYHCSGGCHANSVNKNGSLGEPDQLGCDLQMMRIETAIYLYVKEKLCEF